MQRRHPIAVQQLLEAVLGPWRASTVLRSVAWPALGPGALARRGTGRATRTELALALGALLFDGILGRVPFARAYVTEVMDAGRGLVFDHGALRTVATRCGDLPAGAEAIARVLRPLGYVRAESYDLSRLGMTGHAYRHVDLPEGAPQYFVSELHPEQFSEPFQAAVARVVGTSRDPLSRSAQRELERLGTFGWLTVESAARLLPELLACFERQHDTPRLADYETLLAESPEMAWIATEGNAFNHATDRVEDVHAVAERQRALGRPVKDAVETSRSGRVHQTAFRATPVERLFRADHGELVVRTVPGSFHEFITRERHADGSLDLAFDAGNAQAIFGMTSSRSTA
jgi:hypothetical protein